MSQTRAGTIFLGSVIVPIFCETELREKCQKIHHPEHGDTRPRQRQSESFLQMYSGGGGNYCDLRLTRTLCRSLCDIVKILGTPSDQRLVRNILNFLLIFIAQNIVLTSDILCF